MIPLYLAIGWLVAADCAERRWWAVLAVMLLWPLFLPGVIGYHRKQWRFQRRLIDDWNGRAG